MYFVSLDNLINKYIEKSTKSFLPLLNIKKSMNSILWWKWSPLEGGQERSTGLFKPGMRKSKSRQWLRSIWVFSEHVNLLSRPIAHKNTCSSFRPLSSWSGSQNAQWVSSSESSCPGDSVVGALSQVLTEVWDHMIHSPGRPIITPGEDKNQCLFWTFLLVTLRFPLSNNFPLTSVPCWLISYKLAVFSWDADICLRMLVCEEAEEESIGS